MELNPRYPGHIIFCTVEGVNLPYITYRDLTDELYSEEIPVQFQKKKFLWADYDIRSYYQRMRERTAPNFFTWVKSYLITRSFMYWDPKDIMPYLFKTSLYIFSARVLRKIKQILKRYILNLK